MLAKTIGLTIKNYKIAMTSPLKFFEDDDLELYFKVEELGVDVIDNESDGIANAIFPESAILFIETSNKVDSIESVSINGNEICFRLTNKYTNRRHIGVGRMQIVLFDGVSRKALPPFEFEIQRIIYDPIVYNGLADERGIALLSEDNMLLESTDEVYGIKISELPYTEEIIGFIPIVQHGETRQININTVLDNVDEKISAINDEIKQISNELSSINERLEQGGSNDDEGVGVYIGTTAPENTKLIWIDATTPYNLSPNSYEERLRLNYISMVNKTYFKLLAIQSNISKLENKINEISIDYSSEAGACRAELARQRSRLSVLENQIISTLALLNSETELTSLKARCKQIRADMKSIRYSLADLTHKTMQILDQEKGIIIPDDEGGESGSDDVVTDEYALLTETGLNILTEDGLTIIADVLSTPSNALLTETGVTILTEDGLIILLDGVTTEEAIKDAILNELGVAILTEDGRILLKG